MFAKGRITTTGDVFRDEKSLAFDGSNDYVDCGSDSSLDVGTNDFSVSAWCKVSTKGGSDYHDIVAKGNTLGSGDGWGICLVESNNTIFFDTNGDVARQNAISPSDSWEFGKWYHIVGTRSNSADTLKLYLNGVLVATNASATNDDLGDASINFKIGTSESGRETKGNISEVAYYNSVLTINQVKTIYNGREPYNHKEGVASGNLQAWYRMGDGALDESGFKNGVIGNEKNNTLGTNLVVNGSFEADSNWADYNSVNANVRSTTQVYEGTYSRKFTVDGSSQGIQSDNFTTETNKTYYVTFQIYPDDATTARIAIRKGDNSDWANDTAFSGLTQDAWNKVSLAYTDTAGGSGAYLVIHGHGNTSGDFYIDNAKIQKMGDGAGCLKNMGATNIEGDTP